MSLVFHRQASRSLRFLGFGESARVPPDPLDAAPFLEKLWRNGEGFLVLRVTRTLAARLGHPRRSRARRRATGRTSHVASPGAAAFLVESGQVASVGAEPVENEIRVVLLDGKRRVHVDLPV